LPEITTRELVCAIPLIVLAVVLGVYPDSLFSLMEPTVTKLVNALSQVRVEQVAALLPMLR
jgi:NADH:ubiquinone oxidoreductase subunit 4 (subunit M)